MASVQHPIEVAAAPSRHEVDPDIQGSGDLPDGIEAERGEMPALEPRDRRLRNAGHAGQIGLAEAASDPKHSHC
jgi:hypothetical protein